MTALEKVNSSFLKKIDTHLLKNNSASRTAIEHESKLDCVRGEALYTKTLWDDFLMWEAILPEEFLSRLRQAKRPFTLQKTTGSARAEDREDSGEQVSRGFKSLLSLVHSDHKSKDDCD